MDREDNEPSGQKGEEQTAQQKQLLKQQQEIDLYQEQMKLVHEKEEQIRQQMMKESPLVGDKRDISMMLDEFLNNEGFYIKVQKMHDKYQHYRKTRRDGNCFYRALIFCIMENIHVKNDKKLQEHMLERMKAAKDFMLKAKYEGIVFEDMLQMFIDKLKDPLVKNIDQVIAMMCDAEVSNYLVLMLRFLTAGELKANEELYQVYIDMPVETFCQLEVQAMDKEADQMQIMAILNHLGVGIKIIYLDSNVKTKEATEVILPEGIPKEQIKAVMLYRPGHYDILYE